MGGVRKVIPPEPFRLISDPNPVRPRQPAPASRRWVCAAPESARSAPGARCGRTAGSRQPAACRSIPGRGPIPGAGSSRTDPFRRPLAGAATGPAAGQGTTGGERIALFRPVRGYARRFPEAPVKKLFLVPTLVLLASCGSEPPPLEGVTAYTGITLWDGTGAPAVADAVLVVRDGRVDAAGAAADLDVPAGAETVDLAGKTVIPGFINAHGHVSDVMGLDTGHYTRANLLRQLALYARYGITSIASLGGDGPEAAALRDEQDETLDRARIRIAGEVISGGAPEEAAESVARSLALPADFLKMRVDDNLGANERVAPETVERVMALGAEAGKRVTTHIFYLEDAKEVLRAGSGLIAHSVRDQPVDREFLDLMLERDVCYVPTLVREISTFVYAEVPDFFEDPFFLRDADPAVLEQLADPGRRAQVAASPAARGYREHYPIAMANLKAVADAGVTIAFGTDTGPAGRFQGYFEHIETGEMAEAGLGAEQILRSATSDAARCLGFDEVGELVPGKWADFIVLDENPLEDIAALRSIERVVVAGNTVPGSRAE